MVTDRSGVEEISQEPRPLPPRRQMVLLAAAAVSALAVGVVLGARSDLPSRLGLAPDDTRSPVAVGAIEEGPVGEDGPRFSLPVLNLGDERIQVTLVDIGGWQPPPDGERPSAGLDPGAWGAVRFSAPWDCAAPFPDADSLVVGLRVVGTPGRDDWSAELPERPEALTDYHAAACSTSTLTESDDLSGVWLVEEVLGTRTNLERTQLMRFDPDGTFAADAAGQLFGPEPALVGTYALDGGRLDVRVTSDRACGRGATSTSRVTVLPGDRLGFAFLSGDCPIEPHGVWFARRVLHRVGLPGGAG